MKSMLCNKQFISFLLSYTQRPKLVNIFDAWFVLCSRLMAIVGLPGQWLWLQTRRWRLQTQRQMLRKLVRCCPD